MARKVPHSPGTQFKKGQSGNPKGRPPKLPELETLLADVLGEEKEGIPAAKAILMALRAKAAKGDIRAAEVLLNRGYGLPKQSIDHTSKGESLNKQLNLNNVPLSTLIELARHIDHTEDKE